MKWNHFAFAAFLTAAALLKNGVPLAPVSAGILLSAVCNFYRHKSRPGV